MTAAPKHVPRWRHDPRFSQCAGKSKQNQRRCENDAMPGGSVCRMHGGQAPQVRAAADRRVVLKEAFERGDRRATWEIMADTLHSADVLMLDARVRLVEGEAVTLEQLDRFLEALDRAQRFAKAFLDAGVDERQARAVETLTGRLTGFVDRAMVAIGLPPAVQAQMRQAIAAEVVAERDTAVAA